MRAAGYTCKASFEMAVIKATMMLDLDFCPPHAGLEQRSKEPSEKRFPGPRGGFRGGIARQRRPLLDLAQSNRLRCYERSEEHTSELQSLRHLVCRLLLEKKKKDMKS